MQAWGSGAAMPPLNFAVPNVAFAETYAHLPQPQQNVAIIGGYAAKTCKLLQPSKPMQNKWVKEMQTSLMSFDASLRTVGQFIGGEVQSYYEQGYNNQDYQYQPPAED
jgi:hypothetical protein